MTPTLICQSTPFQSNNTYDPATMTPTLICQNTPFQSNNTYDPATMTPTMICQNTPFQDKFMNRLWMLINSAVIANTSIPIL